MPSATKAMDVSWSVPFVVDGGYHGIIVDVIVIDEKRTQGRMGVGNKGKECFPGLAGGGL